MILPDLHFVKALQVASRSGLVASRAYGALAAYYAATIIAAMLDGLGLVVLASLLTSGLLKARADLVTSAVMDIISAGGIEPTAGVMLASAAMLLAAKTVCNIGIDVADSALFAHIRLQLQRAQLSSILATSWERLRERRVGKLSAALIEETALVCKYMLVAIRGGYFVLSALIFGAIALAVSAELTILLAAIGLPLVLALRRLFSAQSRLSIAQTQVRQVFAADLAERLNNLFQIKLEGNEPLQLRKGLQRGREIAKLEVKIGWGLALISSTNAMVLLAALGGFYLWSLWRDIPLNEAFAVLAGVGIVGSKAAVHANNTLTTIGNLARLAGSILPVHELVCLRPEEPRFSVLDRVTRVELHGVSYRYSESAGLSGVDLSVEAGNPLLVRGPSGSGKTTLANLIAGIYLPSGGYVQYVTASGARFDSRTHKARVGYVPQDIFVFHGTVRDNLVPDLSAPPDEELWRVLDHVGAAHFVRQIGGLEAVLAEAGRSLSGGERRRLGIARALCMRPDILILDEIMSGLDSDRKTEVSAVVEKLSRDMTTVAITHDPQEFAGWREWRTAQPGSATGN